MSTIAAISTAPGVGGIGIVRMSGEKAFDILDKIFVPKHSESIENIKGYTIKYGNIVDGNTIVDEVLVSYFKAPKSYTTENMCEINSHGGIVVVRKILDLCLKNGAEIAMAGEFTKRAFLNGRIDLSQAESVIDVINSKTEKESNEAIKQLNGFLAQEIKNIKNKLLTTISNIEVSIDYPEYDNDTPEVTEESLKKDFGEIRDKLTKLVNTFDNGKIIKEGIKTVIIGKPNVGKSSLLNSILKEERAIVTEFEGTTRDTIEEFVSIEGIPLKLIDTAGIRERTNDVIEKIGIYKSRKIAEEADLIIAIFDSSRMLEQEDLEILELAKSRKSIILLNKMDLDPKINEKDECFKDFQGDIIKISAVNNEGIDILYKKIKDLFELEQITAGNEVIITNERHKNLIRKAIDDLNNAEKTLNENMPIDIIEISLRSVLTDINGITGEEIGEEIINEIFSRFCLGK